MSTNVRLWVLSHLKDVCDEEEDSENNISPNETCNVEVIQHPPTRQLTRLFTTSVWVAKHAIC
jgi:hypothetical protein